MSHFAILRKAILIPKRGTKKYLYEVDQELEGREMSLFACPGKSKFAISRGVPGGDHALHPRGTLLFGLYGYEPIH